MTTQLYVLNKWDLLKRVEQKTLDIVVASSYCQIDDDVLKQQYHNSAMWQSYKTNLVEEIVEDHRTRKRSNQVCASLGWGHLERMKLPQIAGRWK